MDFRKLFLKQSTILVYSAASICAAAVFFPKPTTMPEVRAPIRALKIEVSRTSPAYAALIDLRSDYNNERSTEVVAPKMEAKQIVGLVAGRPASAQVTLVQTVRRLNALQINVEEDVVHAPSAVQAAEELVAAELQKREAAKVATLNSTKIRAQRSLFTSGGGTITIARLDNNDNKSTPARNPFARGPSRTVEVRSPSKVREVTLAANEVKRREPAYTNAFADNSLKRTASFTEAPSALETSSLVEETTGRVSIRGQIQFVNGMAYSPGIDQIFVYQEYSSAQISRGEFYFNQGQYQINIQEPRGRIIAEVRTRDGQLMGRGTIAIRDLADKMLASSIVNNQSIQIAPAESVLKGEVVAASSAFKQSLAVPEARITIADLNREIIREPKSQTFTDKEFRLGSHVMVRAQAPGHWSSQMLAESGSPFQMGLFSNSTMTALLSLASGNRFSARDAEDSAVIWGRLTINGQPVPDAKLELMTDAKVAPIYFNGMIPDKSLMKTSANGEFVFTGLPGGVHYVQATINGEKQLPFVVFADEKAVSQVDYTLQAKRVIEFGVYSSEDASRFQPFRVQFIGVDDHKDMLRPAPQKMSLVLPRAGLTMAEFDPGVDYQQTRAMLSGLENEVHVPAFKNEWAAKLGENLIVGDIEGDSYTVVVMNQSGTVTNSDVKVVYLDEKSEATDKNYGQNGQRFVVKGLTPGFYTVVIVPTNSKDILTDIVYVDSEAITYMNKTVSDF